MTDTAVAVNTTKPEVNGVALLENLISIPATVTKRVNALKNIQKQLLEVEAKFYEEIHILECKYAAMYDPLFLKREKIVNGDYEPNEDESKWALDEETRGLDEEGVKAIEPETKSDVNELVKDLKAKVSLGTAADTNGVDIKGIPDFWLHTFKSTDLISEMIQEYDEPVLKFLRDVRVKMHGERPYGYTIEFHFNDNEYFTNKVLTKTYELTTEVDQKDPFSFDGPVLYKSTGCTIEWNKDKDVTVRLVKKKQKHKSSGTIRVITKEEKQDSFFNYFDNPTESGMKPSDTKKTKSGDDEDDMEDEENLCEADFEIGQFLKDFLIPKAVLYFTGELVDSASYDDEYDEDDEDDEEDFDDEDGGKRGKRFDDEDEDDEEEDEDEEEDDDQEQMISNNKKNGGKNNGRADHKRPTAKGKGSSKNAAAPPECKQN